MSTAEVTIPLGPPVASPKASAGRELANLWRTHFWALGFTYLLLIVENGLRLMQPFLLGWAVNDLLQKSSTGLWMFVVGHVAMMIVQFGRQLYDTRVFSRMYARRVSHLVISQRSAGVPTSRIAARAGLSRQFITFMEQQIPRLVTAVFSCVGGVAMLLFYNAWLVLACLLLAIPVAILNIFFARSLKRVSRDLHDRWEDEVEQIRDGSDDQIRSHYAHLSNCWVRMSDLEARTTGISEIFIVTLLGWSLIQVCGLPEVLPGDIFAVFRYLMMFVVGIDTVPRLVEQLARLRDISGRL
ncbi:ABC transporter six-transmembrane domain-containing protein [Rubinisphaera brasiliensis]|uniref:ABC transmembrane type-1 domain-containing protein n=1 Tax=Rubinisphaera brasiliensis (strain ATCC 49424 / DSM 5305 / JCM 21570 / IAM 15109 / NBRC 103401 / IFAM 1448) TaxID=756272 RepID=F0SQ24_RUBBR|nr:ABC transporter six-transmembrane domain-containing protein [Rubinisphaera brasiliensis]ADY61201.1 hypothetical protein Plabr_3604 [Rubinisphaera brasiliensis DSM 5305]